MTTTLTRDRTAETSALPYVEAEVVTVGPDRLDRLRWFNLAMGVLHLGQGALMVALGNDFELPVSSLNLDGPPGTPVTEGTVEDLFGVRLAWATAAFLWISAFFHFLIASPLGFGRYGEELRHGRNRFRWVEYSMSATLMIVLIAQVTGLTDLGALITIAFANVAMILFGWLMEMVNRPRGRTWWTPFWFGCIAGIGPWAAIFAYLAFNLSQPGTEGPPGFVWGIIASLFVFFNCFAVNQWLQYREVGPWRDYVFGETIYVWLSLTAKSALAWQLFVNVLV